MKSSRRDTRKADRVRAAMCVVLLDAGRPMTIAQLVAAIEGLGLSLGPHGNKVVADAARWEISRGHIRRAGRGVLAAGRVPPSTAFYMRRRLRLYLLDPSQGYSRPSNLPYLPNPPYGPGGPSTPPNE